MPQVLVVDDDPHIRQLLVFALEKAGLAAREAEDGEAAMTAVAQQAPDLVVLDINMPKMDGLEVCRRLRERGGPAIIMVTARSTEEDKLRGLDLGADDYVTKPFSPRELMARVRAVLRRASDDDVVCAGAVTVDRLRREVRVADAAVAVTPTEFRLLETLVRSAGRTFTRQELVERALGEEFDGLDRTIDVHVRNLRRKLGDAGASLVTVFGVGYRWAK